VQKSYYRRTKKQKQTNEEQTECWIAEERFNKVLSQFYYRKYHLAIALFRSLLCRFLKNEETDTANWLIRSLLCLRFVVNLPNSAENNEHKIFFTLNQLHHDGYYPLYMRKSSNKPKSVFYVAFCHDLCTRLLLRLPSIYGCDPNLIDTCTGRPRSIFQRFCEMPLLRGCLDEARTMLTRCNEVTLNGNYDYRNFFFLEDPNSSFITLLERCTMLDCNDKDKQLKLIEMICSESVTQNDGSGYDIFKKGNVSFRVKSDFIDKVNAIVETAKSRLQNYQKLFPVVLNDTLKHMPTPLILLIQHYSIKRRNKPAGKTRG